MNQVRRERAIHAVKAEQARRDEIRRNKRRAEQVAKRKKRRALVEARRRALR